MTQHSFSPRLPLGRLFDGWLAKLANAPTFADGVAVSLFDPSRKRPSYQVPRFWIHERSITPMPEDGWPNLVRYSALEESVGQFFEAEGEPSTRAPNAQQIKTSLAERGLLLDKRAMKVTKVEDGERLVYIRVNFFPSRERITAYLSREQL